MSRDIQVTISGRDAGGYVFQNVLNISTTDDTSPVHAILDAINQEVVAVLIPAYKAAMCGGTFLLDVASKMSGLTSSYTLHNPIDEEGARVPDAAVGALSGVLNFLPAVGTAMGRMFVAGCAVADFVADIISPTYLGMLEDIANALGSWDGTNMTWGWQLLIVNKTADTAQNVVAIAARNRPTTLNKRMRG